MNLEFGRKHDTLMLDKDWTNRNDEEISDQGIT